MKKNPIETILGVFVLSFTALFLFFASSRIDKKEIAGYTVKASFSKVGGLEVGSDVRIAGIKVGSVLATKLDQDTYAADVFMNINSDIKLPIDTVAGIADVGIMGDKYIRLDPGQSKAILKNGDKIASTRNYKSFEDNISDFIFLSTN